MAAPGNVGAAMAIDGTASAQPREVVRIIFPANDKIFFSIPITTVVFELTRDARAAGLTVADLSVEIDGESVPRSAIGRWHIVAGRHYAVFSRGVPWSVTEGGHRVIVQARSHDGQEWESATGYVIETSHPATSGLSGFMSFPSNEAIFSRSARIGVAVGPRSLTGNSAWVNLAPLQFHREARLLPIPLEMGLSHRISGPRSGSTNLSWKLEPIAQEQSRPGIGLGQSDGSLFAVVGWHTNPNRLQGSFGMGAHRLPTGFFGLAYSPSFYRLMIEGDSSRNFNFGLSLTHPRGFRFSAYNVQSGLPRRAWQFQFSLSRGL